MNIATNPTWRLCIQGVDRADLRKEFQGSQWENTWHELASPMGDDDAYSTLCVTLPIPDLDTLTEALSRVINLRPDHGIALYGDGKFSTVTANYSLCTKASPFETSSCTLHRTANSLKSDLAGKIDVAEKALSELRTMIAESEATK